MLDAIDDHPTHRFPPNIGHPYQAGFERGLLTLHARVEPRQADDADYLLREYGVGDFCRSFQIGEGIDADTIHAEIANGALTLHLPKAATLKPRKVQVKPTV